MREKNKSALSSYGFTILSALSYCT